MKKYDVAIVGGGMVGLSLALLLANKHFKVVVIEKEDIIAYDAPTLRVSAFNIASERLFSHLGILNDIYTGTSAFYQSMYVWEKDSSGDISFNAQSHGVSHLGSIIENRQVQAALYQKALLSPLIDIKLSSELKQVAFGENEVFVTLQDSMFTANLIVASDGAHSQLRQFAKIPITFKDYSHHALMARIKTDLPHEGTARQIFSHSSILAFLPQKEAHTSTIVWSHKPDVIKELLSSSQKEFEHKLSAAFDLKLGLCELISERNSFPLTARYAQHFAKDRLVLIGDAAHTIHPLAGQGVNLGLMDCVMLTNELVRLKKAGKDYGQHYYLGRFERSRKQQAAKVLLAMQGFHDLFSGDNSIKKSIRTLGLSLVNRLPTVKHEMMAHALGLHDIESLNINSL